MQGRVIKYGLMKQEFKHKENKTDLKSDKALGFEIE
jgi:hypothetical protein